MRSRTETDVGANLWCPQTDETGKPYWSYSLIQAIAPGDLVFHYSTPRRAFVGASVAGAPVETRSIIWAPHGTVGVKKKAPRAARPGWWRPLYGYTPTTTPLTLATINTPQHQTWVREWASARGFSGAARLPLQLYPRKLRAAQGYLTKMPRDFVDRWPELFSLDDKLSGVQERLAPMAEWYSGPSEAVSDSGTERLTIKSEEDYWAFVKGGQQRRTRYHERLIRQAVELLQARGAKVVTPHPIDLRMIEPLHVIFEAKVVGRFSPILAVRAAIGQLLEYRSFIGPKQARLCVLLDADPGEKLVDYVENDLGMLMTWLTGEGFFAGHRTAAELSPLALTTV